MRKLLSFITFLFLFVAIVEMRVRLVTPDTPNTSFVFMLLLTIVSALFWGIGAGVLTLFITSTVIAYVFLTPYDITQLTQLELRQIGLFILEGLVILLLIYILRKTKEREHDLRERFQIILASIGDAVIATDTEGCITYMNAKAQQLTGCKFRDAKKKRLYEILLFEEESDQNSFHTNMQTVIEEGKTVLINRPITLRNKRGKHYDIQDTFAPLKNINGATVGSVLICKDVSQHREMEQQKEVLLGAISHELKNYITSIQGYSQLLQKKVSSSKDSKLADLTEKLNGKIETMRGMVVSMLDLSKLNVGKLDMSLEPFSIDELIHTTINDMEISTNHVIKQKGSTDQKVIGDWRRVGQVLTNLISNAVKYSPEEQEIHIIIQEKEDEIVVGVRDFGDGIPDQKKEKIFNPFYRAVTEEQKKEITGSGLGLYISKEIIKQHNGEIWVESDTKKGTTFYFTLPIAEEKKDEIEKAEKTIMQHIKKILRIQNNAS